jgi:membrane protease YdiL (CAAX protease family)
MDMDEQETEVVEEEIAGTMEEPKEPEQSGDETVEAKIEEPKEPEQSGDETVEAKMEEPKEPEQPGDESVEAKIEEPKEPEQSGDETVEAKIEEPIENLVEGTIDKKKCYRPLKPWHGIILIVLTAIEVFIVSGYLSMWFGLYGTAISELLLLVLAVGTVLVVRGDMKVIFQFRKPKISTSFGTLVLWLGTYMFTLMITMIVTYLFPEEMTSVSTGLGETFTSVPFICSFIIVAVMPAICEEAVFRGAFFNSLWNGIHKKWPVIIIVSVIFGAFHGSIWRFIPTCILGIAMGYLIFETNNMFYNMLFHAVNNAVPVVMMYLLLALYKMIGTGGIQIGMQAELELTETLPLSVVGIYLMFGAIGILLVYIGKYLLHMGQPGYDKGMFQYERKAEYLAIAGTCAVLMVGGIAVILASIV